MANFPLQIDSLSVLFDNNYAKLTIGVKVSVLGGEEGGGLNVKGVVNINGEHIKNQNSDYWAYKNFDS